MTQLTRRTVLRSAAASAALPLIGAPSWRARPRSS